MYRQWRQCHKKLWQQLWARPHWGRKDAYQIQEWRINPQQQKQQQYSSGSVVATHRHKHGARRSYTVWISTQTEMPTDRNDGEWGNIQIQNVCVGVHVEVKRHACHQWMYAEADGLFAPLRCCRCHEHFIFHLQLMCVRVCVCVCLSLSSFLFLAIGIAFVQRNSESEREQTGMCTPRVVCYAAAECKLYRG